MRRVQRVSPLPNHAFDKCQRRHTARLAVSGSIADNARLPTVFPYREQFEVGALMAYGPSLADVYRRLAGYIDQILKGARRSSSCW
jgi:putative ABC transport system substrate-binding protein